METSQKLKVIIADPAKNITAFVLNGDIPRTNYIPISNRLMSMTELGIEQVGFIMPAREGGEGRMEMMGGEFCGNATRSFGLYLAGKYGKIGNAEVTVEVSGSAKLLKVETNISTGNAKTSMPIPTGIERFILPSGLTAVAIIFEGIVHVILEHPVADESLIEEVRTKVTTRYNPDAFGVMFLSDKDLHITPAVYVKATDSLVYESSCGSGSIATAIYLSNDSDSGLFSYDISQPGGIITAEVEKKSGCVCGASIGGKVTFSDIREITL